MISYITLKSSELLKAKDFTEEKCGKGNAKPFKSIDCIGLVSLFNSIPTIIGYLMPKPSS